MKTSNLAPHQSAPQCASALPFKEIPVTTPAALVDPDVTPEDLRLEFKVRIWGRDREVFLQQRVVSIWKGAIQSTAYRSLATSDIDGQLKHLLETVVLELRQYTKEAEPPTMLKPERTIKLQDGFLPVSGLTADFKEADQTAKLPTPEDLYRSFHGP